MIVDLVNLIAATAEERAGSGSVIVRIDLVRADSVPYAFLQAERFGGSGQPAWSLDVRRFVPVDGVVVPTLDVDARRQVAVRLIGDVSAQFGVSPGDFGYAW